MFVTFIYIFGALAMVFAVSHHSRVSYVGLVAIQLNKLDNISVKRIKRSQSELSRIQPMERGYHRGTAFEEGFSSFSYFRSGVWKHMSNQ